MGSNSDRVKVPGRSNRTSRCRLTVLAPHSGCTCIHAMTHIIPLAHYALTTVLLPVRYQLSLLVYISFCVPLSHLVSREDRLALQSVLLLG